MWCGVGWAGVGWSLDHSFCRPVAPALSERGPTHAHRRFIAEAAPPALRGRLVTINVFFITGGQVRGRGGMTAMRGLQASARTASVRPLIGGAASLGGAAGAGALGGQHPLDGQHPMAGHGWARTPSLHQADPGQDPGSRADALPTFTPTPSPSLAPGPPREPFPPPAVSGVPDELFLFICASWRLAVDAGGSGSALGGPNGRCGRQVSGLCPTSPGCECTLLRDLRQSSWLPLFSAWPCRAAAAAGEPRLAGGARQGQGGAGSAGKAAAWEAALATGAAAPAPPAAAAPAAAAAPT